MKPRGVEYLALPSGVRGLEEKKKIQSRKKKKERREEEIEQQQHTNTAIVLSPCMFCTVAKHDQHTKVQSFLSSVWKLSIETDHWLIIYICTNIYKYIPNKVAPQLDSKSFNAK